LPEIAIKYNKFSEMDKLNIRDVVDKTYKTGFFLSAISEQQQMHRAR
jgi:hypothetical protein